MRACLHCEPVPALRDHVIEPEMLVRHELFMYACEIKETADGSGWCACGEAGQAFQVVA